MSAEPALARASIYRARPFIEMDGQRHEMLDELLLGMQMTENEGGLSALEIRFTNVAVTDSAGAGYAFEHDDVDLLSLGKPIVVGAGDEADPQEIFRGTITGLEFVAGGGESPELLVLAEDALQQARMARRTRLYTDTSVSDLVQAVANELGLRASVDGLTQTLAAELQLNESDLAFLRRVLGRHDADIQVVGEELQAGPRGEVRRGELTLELYSQLESVRITVDLAHQTSGVSFAGWDAAQGREVQVENGSTADLGPGRGRTGKAVLEESLGERPEHLGNGAARDEAEAQALADTRYAQRARRFLVANGAAEGNPELRVGTHLTLRGLGPRFNNTYYVTRTRHLFDRRRGYRTEFEGECAYWGG